MIVKIIMIIIASILSGWLYRAGGQGKPFNTKWRDLGCSLVFLIALWLLKGLNLGFWWAYLLVFGLTFATLTTYWDGLFGYDNFWFHGFMIGLACFPLFWLGIVWWLIGIRAIILAIGMGLWSKFWGWDDMEEGGRGFSIIATLPILLI